MVLGLRPFQYRVLGKRLNWLFAGFGLFGFQLRSPHAAEPDLSPAPRPTLNCNARRDSHFVGRLRQRRVSRNKGSLWCGVILIVVFCELRYWYSYPLHCYVFLLVCTLAASGSQPQPVQVPESMACPCSSAVKQMPMSVLFWVFCLLWFFC